MANRWNKLFERYRNQTKNRHVQYGQGDSKENQVGKFGENALGKNPRLPIFDNAQNNIADIIDRGSVVSQYKTDTQLKSAENFFGSLFSGITAMPIYTNKAERIRQYRAMAQYTDCDFCLTELADDFLHEDEKGNFINLVIPDSKTNLNDDRRKTLQAIFDKFIEIFHFKDNAFDMVKKFLTEGELTYENIINPQKKELGIIGIKYLPTEYYETILNTDTGKPIGIVFDKEGMQKDLKNLISNSCLGARSIFNSIITSQHNFSNFKEDSIPLLYPQLTYMSSGEVSNDGLMTFPLIEKCKQAYHQLALMQDAAVILRVTRAPERLLFNISTGGQADKVARQRIQQFINELKSKKIVSSHEAANGDGSGQDITQVYNPVTMLETYFFGKSNANDGTTVESVGSTADYEQIADIEFFMRKLFKQFKVPFSRFKQPENSMERDETISYEEYSMARMIIRVQRRFAMGLKRSFITHLKLMGLWKKYNLKDSDFQINFVTPILYDLYQQQKMIGAKMDCYKSVTDCDEMSKTVAMKKILRMTDEEIDQNFIGLIKEKQLVAIGDMYADMVSEEHYPIDIKSPLRLNGIDGEHVEGDDKGENKDNNGTSDEEGYEETTPEEPPMPEQSEEGGEEGNEDGGEEEAPSFGLGN